MTEGIFVEDLIGINTLEKNAEMRGSTPMVEQLVKVEDNLAGGVFSFTVQSYFGLGKGIVMGATIYTSAIAGGTLGVNATAGSNAGEVDVTIQSSGSGSEPLDLYVGILGKIIPMEVT